MLARDVLLAALLLGAAMLAWIGVVRADAGMQGHDMAGLSVGGGAVFTLQWGVMMVAMMLPSAVPMILLYDRIRRHAPDANAATIPAEVFALTYVVLWLLTGIPVYVASMVASGLAMQSAQFASAIPYIIALTLLAAGMYQLTPVKHVCLQQCVAPHDFLMRRWRGGYAASLRLAASHAAYCIGCCWALMVVLVVAGAMSLPWVLAIALVVFAEKLLPAGGRTARIVGVALIAAAAIVAARA